MTTQRLEIPVQGMDCAECCQTVQRSITALPGVAGVDVFLASEKAVVQYDPAVVDSQSIRSAVTRAGYVVPEPDDPASKEATEATVRSVTAQRYTRAVLLVLGLVFGAVLFVVVIGEWLGFFEAVTDRIPWPVGLLIVIAGGYPVFRNVIRATMRGEVISHTLMSVGVIAALVVGEWTTAAIVVFFMRIGDYVEHFTTERARRAVKDLAQLSPQTAHVERDGQELDLAIDRVVVGDIVVVRPGEQIPVDGEVISGHATVDQAAITGESMPVEAEPGTDVFAATLARMGHLRIRTRRVGEDTTFGRVVKLVEEAEAHRADVQRYADRFSTYFLPFVAVIAILTLLIRRDPIATAAVLVVACSCSFALATPVAVLASIGAAAKRGLLIKGGKYLEILDKVDVLLIDKTGTLTLGRPRITDIIRLDGKSDEEILTLATAAERYSEHPLAQAVREASRARNLPELAPSAFEAIPGKGIRADVGDKSIVVGNRAFASQTVNQFDSALDNTPFAEDGKTLLYVAENERLIGILAAADTLRPEVPDAIELLRSLGIKHIELLTGDNEQTAAALVRSVDVDYRADLLPEDKMNVVKEYQRRGHKVAMVGDGVNDAPALAQADVGIAMGAAGADIAVEAAHVALMRDDWLLVPEVIQIARRTMRVVRMNFAFTTLYNAVGLTLAALGFLPPIFAAAAQSLPDLGIMANSSRLLRQKSR